MSSSGGLELDDGAWPIVHGSPESLDYTTLPTPTTAALRFYNTQGLDPSSLSVDEEGDDAALLTAMQRALLRAGILGLDEEEEDRPKKSFSMADANPVSIITERVSATEQRLWTSGFKNVMVFRQVLGEPELELLARYDHGGFDFHYHGSYAFVGRRRDVARTPVYVVAVKQDIYRFTLEQDADSDSGSDSEDDEMEEQKQQQGRVGQRPRPRYRLARAGPLRVFEGEDSEANNIVGVTLAGDGTVLVASKGGNVTALREEEADADAEGRVGFRPVSYLPLQRYVSGSDPIHISNSLAVHGQGVFIVTQEEMVRLDVDPVTSQLEFRWATRYGRPQLPWYTSRLGPGSGSTPSVTRCQGRDMVVLTDGELGMALVYLDAETGEELGRAAVDFGPGVDASRVTSEQSVAVRGCQAFVVNNYVGTGGLDADAYCTLAPTPELKQGLAAFCNALQPEFIAKVCPAVFGCVGFGAAMYELGPVAPSNTTSEFAVRRLWGRDDVSCGTSIPLIAEGQPGKEDSTTYCVGMSKGGKRWELLAFDTATGADRFRYGYYPEGKDRVKNFFANPYYAGVEAVGGSALAIGSIGGVIYLTPEPANATAAGAARLGAPVTPPHASPAVSPSLAPGAPLGALLGAVLFLLAAVLLAKQGGRRRKGGAPRLGWLGVGSDAQEEEDDDDAMRYHTLLPSTVEGH